MLDSDVLLDFEHDWLKLPPLELLSNRTTQRTQVEKTVYLEIAA